MVAAQPMNYSKLAPFYQCIEKITMGSALQRARTGQLARLSKLREPRRVLIVGEGDGSFLLSFVKMFPEAVITIVESSEAMVMKAQSRLRRANLMSDRIEFYTQPLLDTVLPLAFFDLIVTLFFFDNFDNAIMRESVAKLSASASTSAHWLLSDFCLPADGWRRLRARFWLWMLYRFFGVTAGLSVRELPDTAEALEASQFEQINYQTLCGGLLFSAVYQSNEA